MSQFDKSALENYYAELSSDSGLTVEQFLQNDQELFSRVRANKDVEDFRLGKGIWKKLRDEIVPVCAFLRSADQSKFTRLRFPLDSRVPDCWIQNNRGEWEGIEVTIERGRERFHLAQELNSKNIARGFIGLQDNDEQCSFDEKIRHPRIMYTTEQALEATKLGILRCLEKKDDAKYASTRYLLVQAHLSSLPQQRWRSIVDELRQRALSLPFQEIFVVPTTDNNSWNLQLKP